MKYLIAYPIRGEAGAYLTKLSNGLAEQFKLEPVTSRIEPHLTIKAPFEADSSPANSPACADLRFAEGSGKARASVDRRELAGSEILEIERIIGEFAKKEKAMPLRLEGFGHFNGKVVFMDVDAPKQTHMLLRRLQDQLRNISWLTWERTEFPLTLHATVCYPKTPEQAKEILHALRKERAGFDLLLDSVAILKKENNKIRWQILREFPISISDSL